MRFGRRKPLYFGGLWQAAWLLIFATIATAQPPTTDNNTGTVMIVAGCMYIASFAGEPHRLVVNLLHNSDIAFPSD